MTLKLIVTTSLTVILIVAGVSTKVFAEDYDLAAVGDLGVEQRVKKH
jgi:hypothetical protein